MEAEKDGMAAEILVTVPLPPAIVAALEESFAVHRLWEAGDRKLIAEVGRRVRGIATAGAIGADEALMDALPRLEIIACYGVGVDAIDLAVAARRGIIVTNTPDVLTSDVADMAMVLALTVLRRICVGDRYVREGRWLAGDMALTTRVAGKRLGIVGLGRIGRAVALRAAPFELAIAYHGPRPKPDVPYRYYDDLVALARASDLLVVTCPGGDATQGLVGRDVLDAVGPTGVLVNVSRGSVVDEGALVAALAEGRLGGAGLDVFADEPQVPEALLFMENVVLQPHHASGTEETRAAMGQLVVDNLRAHFAGRPVLTPV